MPWLSRSESLLQVARNLQAADADGRVPTLEQVAVAAGVSRATVYRQLKSQAELARALGADEAALGARAAVLDAAIQVFAERGIHAATLKEVAARAGLSLSGLHWHFRNKEDLVQAIANQVPVLPVLTNELAMAGTADLEDQLTHIAQVVLKELRPRRPLLRMMLCEATHYPDVARLAVTHTVGRGLPLLAGIFEEHARRETLRPGPARIRAQAFMSMFVVLILMRPVIGDLLQDDDEACAREYVQIALRGVLAAPDAAKGAT